MGLPINILIVHTDPALRRELEAQPWDWLGAAARCVGSTGQAAEALASGSADILLTDAPCLESLIAEAYEALSAVGKHVVLLAGQQAFARVRAAVVSRGYNYLFLPLRPGELRECVAWEIRLLARERAEPAPRWPEGELHRTPGGRPSGDPGKPLDIMGYIDQNYSNCISLTGMAEYFHFTPNYLSKLIRRETGRSFLKLVAERRMSAAGRLLRSTTLSVAEVCTRVGMEDARYFSQVFKRTFGLTPQKFRKTALSALRPAPPGER